MSYEIIIALNRRDGGAGVSHLLSKSRIDVTRLREAEPKPRKTCGSLVKRNSSMYVGDDDDAVVRLAVSAACSEVPKVSTHIHTGIFFD